MGERDTARRATATEEQQPEPPKRVPSIFSLKNIAILVAGITISSLLALFTVGNYIAPSVEQRRLSKEPESSPPEAGSELEDLMFFKMDPLIVNPAGSNGERYLKASVTLEMHEAKVQQELEKRLPQVKNQINNILSSKSIQQIQTNEDREKLRREILNRINGMLASGNISNVYFEEFVYQ